MDDVMQSRLLTKLVQLQKDVENTLSALSERDYGVKAICSRYQDEMLNIFADYRGIMTPINKELNRHRRETEELYANQYDGQLSVMGMMAQAIGDELRVALSHNLLVVDNEIAESRRYVENAVGASVDIAGELDGAETALFKRVDKMKNIHRARIEMTERENAERIRCVGEESERRVSAMTEAHEMSMESLTEGRMAALAANEAQKLDEIIKGLHERSRELETARKVVLEMCNGCENSKGELRDKIIVTVAAAREERTAFQTELAEFLACIEKFDLSRAAEVKEIEGHHFIIRKANRERLAALKEEVVGSRKDISGAKKEAATGIALSRRESDKMKMALAMERGKVADVIIRSEEVVTQELNDLKDICDAAEAPLLTEMGIVRHEWETARQSNDSGRLALMRECEENKNTVIEQYRRERCRLLVLLEQEQLKNADHVQKLAVRDALRESLSLIRSAGEGIVDVGDADGAFAAELREELESVRGRLDRESASYATCVEGKRVKLLEAKDERMRVLEAQKQAVLHEIEREYESEVGVPLECTTDYQNAVAQLNSVAAPFAANAGSTIAELESLDEEKSERKQAINSERRKLEALWITSMEKEVERHERTVQSVGEELVDEQQELRLARDTTRAMNTLYIELKEAERDQSDRLGAATTSKMLDITALRAQLDAATKHYFTELDKAKGVLEHELEGSRGNIEIATREFAQINGRANGVVSQRTGEMQITFHNRKNALALQITALKQAIEDTRAQYKEPDNAELERVQMNGVREHARAKRRGQTAVAAAEKLKSETIESLDAFIHGLTTRLNRLKVMSLIEGTMSAKDMIPRLEQELNEKTRLLSDLAREAAIIRAKLQAPIVRRDGQKALPRIPLQVLA